MIDGLGEIFSLSFLYDYLREHDIPRDRSRRTPRFTVFWRIILPLSGPGIASVFIITRAAAR